MRKILIWILAILFLATAVQGALTDGNVAWWTMDNETYTDFNPLNDSAGNDDTLTNNGAVHGNDSTSGFYDFESGSSQYMTDGDVDLPTEGTITAWIKPETMNNDGGIIEKRESGGNDHKLNYQIATSSVDAGKITFKVSTGAGYYCTHSHTTGDITGKWTMVGLVFNTSGCWYYINDTLVHNEGKSGSPYTHNSNVDIGRYAQTPAYYDGLIDEVAIWNTSHKSITEIFNAGTRYNPYAGTSCTNFTITATNTYWGETLTDFNATVGAVDYTTTTGTITTNICQENNTIENITVRAVNHDNRTYLNYNTSTNLPAVLNFSYYRLNITAIDDLNASINTFSITAGAFSGNTTTGQVILNLTKGATYEVEIDAPAYALARINITMNAWQINHTFNLVKTNSVQIYIWDEITNLPITDNITIRWTSNSTTWENSTNTSELFVYNITPDVYDLLFYGSNYSTRSYTLTVGNRSTQTLNAYMISSDYTTIFTIKDIDTATVLEDVSITMYKLINSSWTTVESEYSDITGKAQFSYDPIASYKFYLSRTDYEDYVFFLTPILFGEYDVFMTRTSVRNYSVDFDGIGIIYSPTQFVNEKNVTFNYLITSPDGLLTDYSIKLTYPGGSDFAEGNNAIGEQLTADVNLTGDMSPF